MSALKQNSSFGTAQIILFFSIAILVIVVAVPVLLIFFNAFWVNGEFNVADVAKIILEPETYQALVNSLIIATGTTIGSTIVGTFFAWLVTRTDLPYKSFMKSMFLVPFMLPSFIGALAWKMLLSPNAGFINKFFINNFGFDGPIFNIYSYLGIVLVEIMYLFPFVFIQVCGALERMDPTLEESARISGAGLFTITRKITIPLVLPSILSGSLLIMLYSMAHFGTVAVLGIENGIFNIPTLIYQRIHQSAGSFESIRTGTVLATVLVVTAALIIWLQQRQVSDHRRQKLPADGTEIASSAHPTAYPVHCLHRLYDRAAYRRHLSRRRFEDLWPRFHLEQSLSRQLQIHPVRLQTDQGRDLEQRHAGSGRCTDHHVRRCDDFLRHR